MIKHLRVITLLFSLVTLIYAYQSRQSHAKFLGVPFEFRFPTPGRIRERCWNAGDARIFTPHIFGVGWSLNACQVLRRLGYVDQDEDEGLGTRSGRLILATPDGCSDTSVGAMPRCHCPVV